jgi:MFS family permease
MISAVVPPRQRGGFMSINSSVQQIATGFASLIGGFIVTAAPDKHLENYEFVGYFGIAVSFLCILLAKNLRPAEDVLKK